MADDDASEPIRYLTSGVLIRFNRKTQRLDPELAVSWSVHEQGRRVDFKLRKNIRFSDGKEFGPADVIATIRRVADPKLHSAVADAFRSTATEITARPNGPDGVSVFFSPAVAGVELLFDQLSISSAGATSWEKSVLGPFVLAEYKAGQYVLLRRNPHYWKRDAAGNRLPRLASVRLDIQANRETELLRFRRGELDLVDKIDSEAFQRLRREMPSAVLNAGPSLDSEILWFNQAPNTSVAGYKQRWFRSKLFRKAISAATNRDDIVRLTYSGYAHPAAGPVSKANKIWVNAALQPEPYNPALALDLLRRDGFTLDGRTLRDREGRPVEFSLITNAGNRARTQIGSMLQQDLQKIGVQLNFTPLEFQSLIERITRTMQYEACLLGFTNMEIDPNTQMNVWMSSGGLHAWHPRQKTPATAWEAEIDELMRAQAAAMNANVRKAKFDRLQELIYDEKPVIYIVHPDVLVAVTPELRGVEPSALPPHLIWNIESFSRRAPVKGKRN